MKIPVLIALLAVTASANAANAQIKSEGRFTFDSLPPAWTGAQAIPKSMFPLRFQSRFDPKLPALPDFAELRAAGVELRVVPTYQGPMLQIEVANASMKDVLKTVTDAWELRAIIDPALAEQQLESAVFRAQTPRELLDVICEFSVKQLPWKDGSLYFVDKVNSDFAAALSENRANERLQQLIADEAKQARDADPFAHGSGDKKPLAPQPGWEKREFNGREFFLVPAPAPRPAPAPISAQ